MKKNVLGLYLSAKTAQALILERDEAHRTLLAVHEWDNTLFNYAGDDTPGVDEFTEQLSKFLGTVSIHLTTVTLDTSLLFINTLPVAKGATSEQIKDHVEWELSEYFPDSPQNTFISDIHTITKQANARCDEALLVAVRRDIIQKIRRSLDRVRLTLDIVDAEHFSADTTLILNYPDSAAKYIALVGIKDDRMDISLVRYNDLEAYYYYPVHSEDDIVERLATLSSSVSGLHAICVFGLGLTQEMIAHLRNSTTVPLEPLNPFRKVEIAHAVRVVHDPAAKPFRYSAIVGVALREE
jgi:Tfp pilus assembly PilM family ATPase